MTSVPPTADASTAASNTLSRAGQRSAIASAIVLALSLAVGAVLFAYDTMGHMGAQASFAAAIGSLVSLIARLMDHSAFTMNAHARRKTDWWDRAYVATRVSLGIGMGIAAAYLTSAVQAGLGTTGHAPLLPVVAAFVGAYASKIQPISLK